MKKLALVLKIERDYNLCSKTRMIIDGVATKTNATITYQ